VPDRIIKGSDQESRRLQQVAPGEYAPEVYVRDVWSAGIGLGQAYILGTGRIELSVAGNLRAALANPAGSGVVATVVALTGQSTAQGWVEFFRNPSSGVPTVAPRPVWRVNPHRGSPAATELRVDTSATVALAGDETGVTLGSPSGSRVEVQIGLPLMPGESFGVNIPFAGAASAALAVYLVEEPL
jgi:hypothetical protein